VQQDPAAEIDLDELRAFLDRVSRNEGTPAEVARARQQVGALFAAEQDRIYCVCLRLVGEPERARDLAQETFLTAYGKLAEFRGEGSFFSWLYGIARFKCMRAGKKKQDALTADGVIEASDPAGSALLSLRRQERDALLMAAAAAVLDEQEQEAVYLRYVENTEIDRITEILEIEDRSGARGLLQRCRRKLDRELRRRLEELGHGTSLLFGSIVS
jgi:RNA polymerase sigma-70 factor, ECF subfamily